MIPFFSPFWDVDLLKRLGQSSCRMFHVLALSNCALLVFWTCSSIFSAFSLNGKLPLKAYVDSGYIAWARILHVWHCVVLSCGRWNRALHTWGLQQQVFIPSQFWRPDVWNGFPGPQSRCPQGRVPSRDPRGESIPCLPASSSCWHSLWLTVTSLQSASVAYRLLPFALCVLTLPLLPDTTV